MWTIGLIGDHLTVEKVEDGVMIYVAEDYRTSSHHLFPKEAEALIKALKEALG